MPFLTEQQALERLICNEHEDAFVEEAKIRDNYVEINTDKFSFSFSSQYGVVPRVGDLLRVYSRKSYTRGVDVNGSPVYFKTDEEMDKQHEEWVAEKEKRERELFKATKAKLDAEYKALPAIFRKRIRWFRKHNENFRWKFESYEMLCCTDAVKIAEKCATPEAVRDFMKASHEFQKSFVPNLTDGHSGNSFGMACRLAYAYLEDEQMVFFEHGALTPLVGCVDYGCAHPRPGIEKYAKEKGWSDEE